MQVNFFVPVIIKGGTRHLGYFAVSVKEFVKAIRCAKDERGFYGVDVSEMDIMRNYYLRSEPDFEYNFSYEEL